MLLILFFVYLIFDSEKQLDKKRAEYAASEMEYQEALKAYQARNDTITVAALQDSLKRYSEPEWVPRGAIGFNIGGAFFLVFALAMLIPLAIGLLLLLYYRYRKRKWLLLAKSL